MEKFKVSFEANNQQLKSIGTKHASDTYADIEASFVLGEKWTDMDSVSAVWWNDFTRVATVLDSQGKCIVPHEVLTRKGCVRVNLVGSIVEGGELITRLTSYSAEAVQVNEKIKLTGSETSELTPSQFEQFVTEVKADADRAETVRDEAEAARDVAVSAKDTAVNAVEGFEDIVDTVTATAVQTIQGEGATQVTAIQTEGTTQVASVRTEGSTQVTAVQDKGDEVLDSIPADYTQLSQDVTDLKSDLRLGYEVKNVTTNGSFGAAGLTTGATNRIRTDLIPFSAGDKIIIESGSLQHACGMWQGSVSASNIKRNDDSFSSNDETITTTYNGYLVVVFRNSSNSALSPTDFDGSVKAIMNYQNAIRESIDNLKYLNANPIEQQLSLSVGKYVNRSGQLVTGGTALASSDLILIPSYTYKLVGKKYNANASSVMYALSFYDKSGTFLSGVDYLSSMEISADDFPSGSAYVRLCNYDTQSTPTHDQCTITFYVFGINNEVDTLKAVANADTSVCVADVFTDKAVTVNTNIDYSTGNANTNAYFAASGYVAVEAETAYHVMRNNFKLSSTGNIAFYDANKTYISGQQSNWSDWTTPANCAYVRFSVYYGSYTSSTFSFDGVYIVKGSSASALNNLSALTASQYSPLYGKKWVGIGDSLTEVNARADLRYWNYIVQPYGMTFSNFGIGGTGYINRQNESKAFYQRALNIDTDADIITVFGGVNDCLFATADIGEPTDSGTTTWCGCVNALIDNIRGLYSYAPLGIISPLPCDWVDSNSESQYDTQLPSDTTCRMSIFVDKLKAICALRGVPFLDLFHQSGMLPDDATFNSTYYSCGDAPNGDGLHPNSEGHKLFYCKIEKFLETLLAE